MNRALIITAQHVADVEKRLLEVETQHQDLECEFHEAIGDLAAEMRALACSVAKLAADINISTKKAKKTSTFCSNYVYRRASV